MTDPSIDPVTDPPLSEPLSAPLRDDRADQGPDKGPAVELSAVSKAFGSLVVLDELDLRVETGESLVIIGGSGTGKSVLLKHIIGLLRPDSGTVRVEGTDLSTLGSRQITRFRRRFGMAFQEGALFDSLTVAENVAFPLRRVTDFDDDAIAERVEECLEMVQLGGTGAKLPSELSGGMRRRVGFARAIAHRPRILLFDEPTTGLDPVITALVDEVILTLTGDLDATALTITHDMTSAFRIADRVAMLHGGRIVAAAAPEEFRRLDDPRVQQFIHGEATGPLTEGEIAGRSGPDPEPDSAAAPARPPQGARP